MIVSKHVFDQHVSMMKYELSCLRDKIEKDLDVPPYFSDGKPSKIKCINTRLDQLEQKIDLLLEYLQLEAKVVSAVASHLMIVPKDKKR